MVNRIVLLIFLLSLVLTPFAGLAPLMLLGLLLGVFSLGESLVHIIFSDDYLELKNQEVREKIR